MAGDRSPTLSSGPAFICPINAKRLLNVIGVAILCLAIIASFWRVTSRNLQAATDDQIELRIGHVNLHPGLREAFDTAIQSYQHLHPHVSIVQVPIPARFYRVWSRIQFFSEPPVDILSTFAMGEEDIRRHFAPLTQYLEEPNPYNAGTSLEGVPWRDTFFDGLSSMRQTNDHIYTITLQAVSVRLFVNLDLLREINRLGPPRP